MAGPKQSPKSPKSPYRGGDAGGAATRKDDEGLVGDIVRQFADPYAFFRELVQNSIDAGATRIAARIVYDASERIARISVNDDGSGMSQEILEGDLTVLFKSTKENRDDAIGKFGIGFVSVLAIGPTLVAVDTSLGDGVRHRLELHADYSYDLMRASGGERGTTVTLSVPTEPDAIASVTQRSQESLEHWCRHARIPITLTVHGDGISGDEEPRRIDRPLGLEGALLQVSASLDGGRTELVLGLAAHAPRGAFYNRGLLLFESHERYAQVGMLVFKVVDSRLEHTLSRDDVRRDAHFTAALEAIRKTAHGPLTDAVHAALEGAPKDRWTEIFDAADRADLPLSPARLHVPLAVPIGGAPTWPLARFDRLRTLPAHAGLAEALAARGQPIADLAHGAEPARIAELARLSGAQALPADASDAHVEPVVDSELEPLLVPLGDLLKEVHREPSALRLVEIAGFGRERLTLGLAAELPATLPADELGADPLRLLMRPPLLLSVTHPVMLAARRAMKRRVPVKTVAQLVARAILAERGVLTEALRDTLLESAIRSAGSAP